MASPQLQNIIQMLRSRPLREGTSFEEVRTGFEALAGAWPLPEGTTREPASANGVPGEWITVEGGGEGTTIFYIHGGGWTIGSLNTHAALVANICKATGARAFSIDYRLAPEHPFPAGLDDCLTAYRWLLGQEVDPRRLVIAGDSAGGNLALATLIRLKDEGLPQPAAAVALSPATDLEATGESYTTRREADPMLDPDGIPAVRDAYCPGQDVRNPYISPLYGDLSGLPPLLLQVGDAEILLDDSTRFARLAEKAGVDVTLQVWDEMIHVFQFFASILPEGAQAIDRIGEFIRSKVRQRVTA